MANYEKNLREAKAKFDKALAECNAAIKKNDLDALTLKTEALKGCKKTYNADKKAQVYDGLKKLDNPIREALALAPYTTITFKEVRDPKLNTLKCYEVAWKSTSVDLRDFCSSLKADLSWVYDLENLNFQFAIKAEKEYRKEQGATEEEASKAIEEMERTFMASKKAYAMRSGKTPTSNTQILHRMQEIFDKILFEDDGTGKNRYKLLNKDIRFLLDGYLVKDRSTRNALKCSDQNTFRRSFIDMMHCVVTDKKYAITYKQIDSEKIPDYVSYKDAYLKGMEDAQKSEKVSEPKTVAKTGSKKKVAAA